jgi:predicted RNase H-like nuclease (RuvC/YqgF family)
MASQSQSLAAAVASGLAGGGVLSAVLSYMRDRRKQRSEDVMLPVEIDAKRVANLLGQVEIMERINNRLLGEVELLKTQLAEARAELEALRRSVD